MGYGQAPVWINGLRPLKGTSKNALFPRLRRRRRAPILRYHLDTAVARAVLLCTHEKMTIFSRCPQAERLSRGKMIWRRKMIWIEREAITSSPRPL